MGADRSEPKTRVVTSDEREQIEAAIRAGKPRNEVAREFGRAAGTVTTIAREAGLSFDRAPVAEAIEARKVDHKARRLALVVALYDDADWMRRQLREECTVHGFTKDGFATGKLATPPASDKRALMTAVGIALDKALLLERADGGDEGKAKGLLERLVEGLGQAS